MNSSSGFRRTLLGLLAACVAVAGLAVVGFGYWTDRQEASCRANVIPDLAGMCARTDMVARVAMVDIVVFPRDVSAVAAGVAILTMLAVFVWTATRARGFGDAAEALEPSGTVR